MKIFAASRGFRSNSRRAAAVLLLAAAFVAACSPATLGAGPSASPSPAPPASPGSAGSAVPSLVAAPTADSILPSFTPVPAGTCDPALVPRAASAATLTVTAPAAFRLMVPILMYHRIVPTSLAGNSLPGLVVPPETFTAQMAALSAAGWHTVTLSKLADDLAAGITPSPRTFVITIDDGWADGYEYAAPILESYGLVATFFVIAGRIGWPDFLGPAQLRGLIAMGNEIGNHTLDHERLVGLTDARLAYEIGSGSATIAAATGLWPVTFAYPLGAYTARSMAAVEACAGMRMAVIEGDTTWETWATRFATPRIRVGPGFSPSGLVQILADPPTPNPPSTARPSKAAAATAVSTQPPAAPANPAAGSLAP
jgi:peptidoglycan/xylan/chitin deacetylase (PgdA/CDA1 family)